MLRFRNPEDELRAIVAVEQGSRGTRVAVTLYPEHIEFEQIAPRLVRARCGQYLPCGWGMGQDGATKDLNRRLKNWFESVSIARVKFEMERNSWKLLPA